MERVEQMPKPIVKKEAPTYPTLGESVKQVFYGVGKAVEWHMPHKWNERIIRAINTKIIPKLTPEQRKKVWQYKKLIEGTVTGVSIGISTLEFMVAATVAERGVRKIYALVEKVRLNRALKKKYPYKPASSIDVPVVWATDPRSESIVSEIAGPAIVAFGEKYGTGTQEYKRFGKIMMKLQWGSVDMGGWGLQQQFRKIYESASSPVKSPYAKLLKPLFIQTFKDVVNREGWIAVTETQKALMNAEAERLFRKWKNLQFSGLPDMILAGKPWGDVTKEQAENAVLRLARKPKDFWLLSKPELIPLDHFLVDFPEEVMGFIEQQQRRRQKAIDCMKQRIREIAAQTPDAILRYEKRVRDVRGRKQQKQMLGTSSDSALDTIASIIQEQTDTAHRNNPTIAKIAREGPMDNVMERIRRSIAAAAEKTVGLANPVRPQQGRAMLRWLGIIMRKGNSPDVRREVYRLFSLPTDTRQQQIAAATAATDLLQKILPKSSSDHAVLFPRMLQWVSMGKPGLSEVIGYILDQRLKW